MPYVPSLKTNPSAEDRKILDPLVKNLAEFAAGNIVKSPDVVEVFSDIFIKISFIIHQVIIGPPVGRLFKDKPANALVYSIMDISKEYKDKAGDDGAFLGELNYSITRFIQEVPKVKVARGEWKSEFRYWYYACTAEALLIASHEALKIKTGIAGVFDDIKAEYKRRVNVAYEAEQILKSGDCYDGPFYTRLVRVVDENGNLIGHQEVMLKRSEETVNLDELNYEFVAVRRK